MGCFLRSTRAGHLRRVERGREAKGGEGREETEQTWEQSRRAYDTVLAKVSFSLLCSFENS